MVVEVVEEEPGWAQSSPPAVACRIICCPNFYARPAKPQCVNLPGRPGQSFALMPTESGHKSSLRWQATGYLLNLVVNPASLDRRL